MNDFFYDAQIRRFIGQFIKIVSNFQVQFGKDANGITSLQRVPVIYGDQSRQAAQIVRGNSENALSTVPIMAAYISSFQYDRERVQDPTLVSKMSIRERAFDPVTGTYTQQQGDAYTVERLMPAPYKLTLKLDVWTSNTEQKFQLLEQLTAMFNPALEIQSTDNYIDWTSLSYVLLTDVNWSSRTVPTGGEEPIDIATLTFDLPIWISTSIKVKKLGVVQSVINNMQELPSFDSLGLKTVTLLNYGVLLQTSLTGYTLTLLKSNNILQENDWVVTNLKAGGHHAWAGVLEEFGRFKSGISQLRLHQSNGTDIIGTITSHPTDPYVLLYNPFVDTLPANTVKPIDAVIDPLSVNVDEYLTNPATGTRYLLIQDIGSWDNPAGQGALAWQGADNRDLVAHAHDIIEFNGSHWVVSFDSQTETNLQYVTNLKTGIQYKWQDNQWIKSFDGVYHGGQWSLAL